MKEFENKIVVITGASHGIGAKTKELFEAQGALVLDMDIQGRPWFPGDVSDFDALRAFATRIRTEYGRVNVLVNNALPPKIGIHSCSLEEFRHALDVGLTAPYYLSQLLLDLFEPDSCIINISSTRDSKSQPESESYAAAKGGLRALSHAMAASLGPKVRVNSISPGWIDTWNSELSPADRLQQPAGMVGRPEDIAWLILFLASEKGRFIDGENIRVDGGMSHLMIYHEDHGWSFDPET